MNQEIAKQIQELQVLEQNLQNFMAQKQLIQLELNETNTALEELKKASGDVYKVFSGIMIKADKEKLSKDLGDKRKLLELRVNSLEKQEKIIESKVEELRKKVSASMEKEKA
jgi:prefoldin beta subunit